MVSLEELHLLVSRELVTVVENPYYLPERRGKGSQNEGAHIF